MRTRIGLQRLARELESRDRLRPPYAGERPQEQVERIACFEVVEHSTDLVVVHRTLGVVDISAGLCEALERYSAIYRGNEPRRRGRGT